MTDHHKVYTKVLKTLKEIMKLSHPGHVTTLAMMIAGIVMSRKAQLSTMSAEAPVEAKEKSIENAFSISCFHFSHRINFQWRVGWSKQSMHHVDDVSYFSRGFGCLDSEQQARARDRLSKSVVLVTRKMKKRWGKSVRILVLDRLLVCSQSGAAEPAHNKSQSAVCGSNENKPLHSTHSLEQKKR